MSKARVYLLIAVVAVTMGAACKKKPPVAKPTSPPPSSFPGAVSPSGGGSGSGNPVRPPAPPTDPTLTGSGVPKDPTVTTSPYAGKSPDDINQMAPLHPVFFNYDSDELDDTAKKTLDENAELLKQNAAWVITVEGHCDERGTAEYNLALGDRRALAAKNYLISLGISADRVRTVSYGKEFPFETGHDEKAFQQNRRAHFMVTAAK